LSVESLAVYIFWGASTVFFMKQLPLFLLVLVLACNLQVQTDKQIRKEFTFNSFSRSFTLDEAINSGDISARYENGILFLNLPKKEKVKTFPKAISFQ